MDAQERDSLTAQSQALRADLKSWETVFAATHNGSKPAKEDIKGNPSIAQKYRDYNKLRDILSGKIISQEPASLERKEPRKRKHEIRTETPSKRLQLNKTPSKPSSQIIISDQYDSPSAIRKLFTPIQNKVIGPTPQKDGQVLGLFDLLPDEDSPTAVGGAGNLVTNNIQATPSKSRHNVEEPPDSINRHSRTPASSGKRFMLDSFATPLKRRHPNEQGGRTPSSVSKLNFSTPSFLRRDSQRTTMPAIEEDEDGIQLSPQMFRLPPKPLVRGLSSMLASLRKMEEEAADDDLDALHEMEGGSTSQSQTTKATNSETILVEDSQVQLPLGGFDDEGMYDSEPEEQLGRDGQPLKVWKKKGQKRTTRKVNMKPVRPKPQSQAASQPVDPPPDLNDEIAPTEEVVAETQVVEDGGFMAEARNFNSDSSGSEYTASEGGTRRKRQAQATTKKKTTRKSDGTIVKKVGALAHANFKRLKLRNSGAKGGPGQGSRFRRRK